MLFDPYAYDLARPAQQPPLPCGALTGEALLEVPAEARAVLWRGLTGLSRARLICGNACLQATGARHRRFLFSTRASRIFTRSICERRRSQAGIG